MAGYWRDPQATAAVFDADGWLRTNDAGYADADGWIYFADRMGDIIKRAGENVAAADAEAAAGDAESAFDRLLALMAAAPDRKPEIRDRLLELFALFDPTDPRVLAARGKLASALF